MEDNPEYKHSLADILYPYAKWTMISLIAGRMVLMLLSIKYLSITKFYFWYEMLAVIIDQCFMPLDKDAHRGNLFLNNLQ